MEPQVEIGKNNPELIKKLSREYIEKLRGLDTLQNILEMTVKEISELRKEVLAIEEELTKQGVEIKNIE